MGSMKHYGNRIYYWVSGWISVKHWIICVTAALSSAVLSTYTLYLCSVLSVVAFILSIFLIADPLMIFERRLVGMERKLDFAARGIEASQL